MGKCSSWMGHKYQPRFSKGAMVATPKYTVQGVSEAHIEEVLEKYRTLTYERDICVRCGHVIERKDG